MTFADSFGSWLNLGTLALTKEYQRSFATITSNNRYRITYQYNPLILNQYRVRGFRVHLRNVISDGLNEMYTTPILLFPKQDVETISFPLEKDISFNELDLVSKFLEAKYYYNYNVFLPDDVGSLLSVKLEAML